MFVRQQLTASHRRWEAKGSCRTLAEVTLAERKTTASKVRPPLHPDRSDGKTLWSPVGNSQLRVLAAGPELLGGVRVGKVPDWLTFPRQQNVPRELSLEFVLCNVEKRKDHEIKVGQVRQKYYGAADTVITCCSAPTQRASLRMTL